MAALAWLSATRAQAAKRGTGTSDPGMIGYTLAEIRKASRQESTMHQLSQPQKHAWSWSRWRRKRQHQARHAITGTRGYLVT